MCPRIHYFDPSSVCVHWCSVDRSTAGWCDSIRIHPDVYFAKTFQLHLALQVLVRDWTQHGTRLDGLLFLYHTAARSPTAEGVSQQVPVPAQDLTP